MRLIFFAIFFSFHCVSFAKKNDVQINQDVFECGESVKALASEESRVLMKKDLNFPMEFASAQEGLAWVMSDLSHLSSARGRLLEYLLQNIGRTVLIKKNIEIQRFSLPSNLITPTGCTVKPLMVLSIVNLPDEAAVSVLISQDLLEKMSIQDQVLAWWTLTLDVEQALFKFEKTRNNVFADFEFDQLRSRNFIQCWLDSNCKPNDQISSHRFSLKIKLDYFQQDQILIPAEVAAFDKAGLIRKTGYVVSFFNPVVDRIFMSSVLVAGKTYDVESTYANIINDLVLFDEQGHSHCAAIDTIFQTTGLFQGAWESALPVNSFPFSFPVCWAKSGAILQGYFPISWQKKFVLSVQGSVMAIGQDPAVGGKDQGTPLILYPSGQVKWISHIHGEIKIGKNNFAVNGYLKLREDETVECASISQSSLFPKSHGGVFKYYPEGESQPQQILCFNQAGEYEKLFFISELPDFFEKDLYTIQ